MNPQIEESWKTRLMQEFTAQYFSQLKEQLTEEKKRFVIYPPGSLIFSAFDHTPFDAVKVVIIGQDPYHGAGQANGLCFSVSNGIPKPPSLENIFKELKTDLGISVPVTGNLEKWANQGVLLLNASLTVRANTANSHQNLGWHTFTDAVIRILSDQKQGLVFLLWGKFAQGKEALIDISKHHILKAAHPSPLSAYNGFFGCRHFSKTNELLRMQGKKEIDWAIE
ncbi:MAG TPA: uracil-DNA glycosylase [Bacteroidales bacterium]|nr:uracil-DNA glycosylase [Bacteroidales bacterium]HPB24463.1 uracil-DNA glycosylase [Bacteroidales bacterium]HPI29270.1 uracil-DNA glycosylase [Bacteroidales bacterium]HQN15052.1 uracil-DNA glycosylase [Bacteroidales bacterium]HQP14936.1 uracil-DNA glycosylase [Bacteroidales bacterium]